MLGLEVGAGAEEGRAEFRVEGGEVIDERFGVRGRHGVDIEILGGTGVNGGGFLYTNLDTLSVGVVLKLPALAAQKRRPEEIIADITGFRLELLGFHCHTPYRLQW